MNEKQRAEFEKWAVQHKYDLTWIGAINCYAIMRTRIVFDAWQAAIASVVVELPCWSEYDTPRQAIEACAERIKAS